MKILVASVALEPLVFSLRGAHFAVYAVDGAGLPALLLLGDLLNEVAYLLLVLLVVLVGKGWLIVRRCVAAPVPRFRPRPRSPLPHPPD